MMVRVTRTALLLLLALIASCSGDVSDPEEQVRAWVDAMREAAGDKARGDIVAGISEAYIDARGNSRDDIDKLLRLYFLRQDKIALLSNIDEVKVIGGTAAEVSVTVAMAGTTNNALGFSADAYRFELELEYDGDDWQLISARWGELGEQIR
jgi:hypothetical protein